MMLRTEFIFIGIIISCHVFILQFLIFLRKEPPRKSKIVLCLAPYYFRVCLRFNSWFAFEMVVAFFVSYNIWHVFL